MDLGESEWGGQSIEFSTKLLDLGHALGSDERLTEQGYGSSYVMPLARFQGVGNDVHFPASHWPLAHRACQPKGGLSHYRGREGCILR